MANVSNNYTIEKPMFSRHSVMCGDCSLLAIMFRNAEHWSQYRLLTSVNLHVLSCCSGLEVQLISVHVMWPLRILAAPLAYFDPAARCATDCCEQDQLRSPPRLLPGDVWNRTSQPQHLVSAKSLYILGPDKAFCSPRCDCGAGSEASAEVGEDKTKERKKKKKHLMQKWW